MEPGWKPSWNVAADLEALPLTAEDTQVLTRLDGQTSLSGLATLTGLPPEQVVRVLNRLVSFGAVDPPANRHVDAMETAAEPEAPAPDDEEDASAPVEATDATGTHRKLFETQLHALTADERASRAATAIEPFLSAFCFDPLPAVIKAVLTNPSCGLGQARLIAQHHRHPVGLEAVATRGAFAADAGVRRFLVRNPQLPASLFNRVFAPRRMLELFRITISREIPEQTRRLSRDALRRRFASGVAEERVELILKSEGRVLGMLIGIPVDGRTAALLCGRPYTSTTLIQNIARWSAAPPALIAHLLKQEAVRRSPSLRTLLARHPNAPTERPRR